MSSDLPFPVPTTLPLAMIPTAHSPDSMMVAARNRQCPGQRLWAERGLTGTAPNPGMLYSGFTE